MNELYDRDITAEDKSAAHLRARYTTEMFKCILRSDLERCLGQKIRVRIEDFVDYFNHVNVARKHKPLDTHGVKYAAYFEALTDVCYVDREYRFIYRRRPGRNPGNTQSRERTRSQPPSAKPLTSGQAGGRSRESSLVEQRERSLSVSPTLEIARRTQRAAALQANTAKESASSKSLTITEVLQTVVAFTHTLSGKTLPWEEYLTQLKKYDTAAFERLAVLRPDSLEFVKEDVSGSKNKIDISGPPTTLWISECSCCRSCSQSPVYDDMESEEHAFASAESRFKQTKMPLNTSCEVHVVDTDPQSRKLGLHFILMNHDFNNLHAQLRDCYRNNEQAMTDIKVGTVCAVPLDGTKDYHRGIVKDISDPSSPVVYYIDLGIERWVARGCLRRLHDDFYKTPTFCLAGEVRDSPLYDQRVHLANKLRMKGNVILEAEEYDAVKSLYRVLLDTDSGIMSDAN